MADQFDSALDLLRRLNPANTTRNLTSICNLVPHLTEDLLSAVDQPLEVRRCAKSGRDYLLCDYNRDGDSWRSPWSNEFYPPVLDGEGAVPSQRVRKMEVAMNEGMDVYRDLYYEGGISSVYLWDLDDGFAGVILLKKSSPTTNTTSSTASWDSIHVFEALESPRSTQYKLTSTVILQLGTSSSSTSSTATSPSKPSANVDSTLNLSGNLTRQSSTTLPVLHDTDHITNIGKMIEDMEGKMRNLLQEVYFGKARDVVGDLRSLGSLEESRRVEGVRREVVGQYANR